MSSHRARERVWYMDYMKQHSSTGLSKCTIRHFRGFSIECDPIPCPLSTTLLEWSTLKVFTESSLLRTEQRGLLLFSSIQSSLFFTSTCISVHVIFFSFNSLATHYIQVLYIFQFFGSLLAFTKCLFYNIIFPYIINIWSIHLSFCSWFVLLLNSALIIRLGQYIRLFRELLTKTCILCKIFVVVFHISDP